MVLLLKILSAPLPNGSTDKPSEPMGICLAAWLMAGYVLSAANSF